MTKTKTTTARRTLALVMTVLMLMTVWVFVAPTKAVAYNDYSKPYSTEYYYPQGTKFVKNFQLTYDSSKSDAQSQCKPSGFSSGSTFPDSYNAVHDYTHNAAWVNQDLNEDAGGSYVYMGYTLTDDPTAANACKSVGIETSEWGNYKSDNSVSATVNGKTVT
ncbi:MAG: hypothetical protein II739_02635, partial [Clostridia bacterium]|nr:hypothetical protein [Clostridia bacterium]